MIAFALGVAVGVNLTLVCKPRITTYKSNTYRKIQIIRHKKPRNSLTKHMPVSAARAGRRERMQTSPCKGCEEREVGCHARCIAYRQWKGEVEAERKYQRDAISGLTHEISQYTSMTKPRKGGGGIVEYG